MMRVHFIAATTFADLEDFVNDFISDIAVYDVQIITVAETELVAMVRYEI